MSAGRQSLRLQGVEPPVLESPTPSRSRTSVNSTSRSVPVNNVTSPSTTVVTVTDINPGDEIGPPVQYLTSAEEALGTAPPPSSSAATPPLSGSSGSSQWLPPGFQLVSNPSAGSVGNNTVAHAQHGSTGSFSMGSSSQPSLAHSVVNNTVAHAQHGSTGSFSMGFPNPSSIAMAPSNHTVAHAPHGSTGSSSVPHPLNFSQNTPAAHVMHGSAGSSSTNGFPLYHPGFSVPPGGFPGWFGPVAPPHLPPSVVSHYSSPFPPGVQHHLPPPSPGSVTVGAAGRHAAVSSSSLVGLHSPHPAPFSPVPRGALFSPLSFQPPQSLPPPASPADMQLALLAEQGQAEVTRLQAAYALEQDPLRRGELFNLAHRTALNIRALEDGGSAKSAASRTAVRRPAAKMEDTEKLNLSTAEIEDLWRWKDRIDTTNKSNGWTSEEDKCFGLRAALPPEGVDELNAEEASKGVVFTAEQSFSFFFQRFYELRGYMDVMKIMASVTRESAPTYLSYFNRIVFIARMCGVPETDLCSRFVAGLDPMDQILIQQCPPTSHDPSTITRGWARFLEKYHWAEEQRASKGIKRTATTSSSSINVVDTKKARSAEPVEDDLRVGKLMNHLEDTVLNITSSLSTQLHQRTGSPRGGGRGGGGGGRGSGSGGRGNGSAGAGPKACNFCRLTDHLIKDCPLYRDPTVGIECYNCRERGHISTNCPNKQPAAGSPAPVPPPPPVHAAHLAAGEAKAEYPTVPAHISCARCGRSGHDARLCWAVRHANGTDLGPRPDGNNTFILPSQRQPNF